MIKSLLVLCCLVSLTACFGRGDDDIPPQFCQGIQVDLETRPRPIQLGMNEFLVSTTRPVRRAVHDLVISIRAEESAAWVQSIQDGHTGIYRRAIAITGSEPHYLWVRLEQGSKQTVLRFPLGEASGN